MKRIFLWIIWSLCSMTISAQTIVEGKVLNSKKAPLKDAVVFFKNTDIYVETSEDGSFTIESDQYHDSLGVTLVGYEDYFTKIVNNNIQILLKESNFLEEMKIYTGKTLKKNNPAIDILRKIWENRKKNGLHKFDYYQYDKYEKIEFDLNNIDSSFMSSKAFKGMEFIFENVDTSAVTGKTYLPVFINEQSSAVYGNNLLKQKKELIRGIKNTGIMTDNHTKALLNDLYVDYDIYDNYIRFFDKDFVSPLSRTGIHMYNYVLVDTAYIDDKLCYNIRYYPRRKGELTFRGDFWVNDSTWAIKKINLASDRNMNINWVREFYLEQEYEVLDDSVFLLKKDYVMADFSIRHKEDTKGMYGKRSTFYNNYQFGIKKAEGFYKSDLNTYNESIVNKSEEFWNVYRYEPLSEEENNVYQMLETLKENKKFKSYLNVTAALASEYYQIGWFDYGPVFSTFGYNDVEGIRLRAGGRTYFTPNDKWRLEGYTAYGFKDDQFKYGISGKYMLQDKSRFILFAGNRRDVEQIAASLSPITDVLGRSFASSSLLASGDNAKLTSINLTTAGFEIEPIKDVKLSTSFSYKTLKSAAPDHFSLDYYDIDTGQLRSDITQAEIHLTLDYTPKRKNIGYGVDRTEVDDRYARLLVNYSLGVKGMLGSDFDYKKIQLLYRHPISVGGFGWLTPVVEMGKTYGEVPLGLLSVLPGNQSYFIIQNAFSQVDYYEFVTDTYFAAHLEHNFDGRLFSRLPYVRNLRWREYVGIRAAYGTISEANKSINASGLVYKAPDQQMYYEYFVGVGNIFKCLRIDVSWRGNYLDIPNARRVGVKAVFGFHF